MRYLKGLTAVLVCAASVALSVSAAGAAGQPPVELGTAASYGVLARESVSNSGATTVIGDLGIETTSTVPAGLSVSGLTNIGNPAAAAAVADARKAYADAAGRAPATPITGDLAGRTLPPGVYAPGPNDDLLVLDGTLTLDAQGDPDAVWVFQCDYLIVDQDSRVVLTNGARFCRVFWQVGSAADIGPRVTFVGHVLGRGEVNLMSGSTVRGQLIAIGYDDDGYYGGDIHIESNRIDNSAYACTTPSLPRTGYAPSPERDTSWLPTAAVLAALIGASALTCRVADKRRARR